MVPDLGLKKPQIVFMIVDLPAPFSPIRPVIAPGSTETLTFRRMSMSPT